MDLAREILDCSYLLAKPLLFKLSEKNPEKAHEGMIRLCQFSNKHPMLEKFLLNHSAFSSKNDFQLSNAAGFNKNGDIPIETLYNLGFDRAVIGTVTFDPWPGNNFSPRIWRYAETESLVNCLGLPGVGARKVLENLRNNTASGHITLNYMATPGKKGDDIIQDQISTIASLRNLPMIDRFELNISCPNTHNPSGKMDARKEYMQIYDTMLMEGSKILLPSQDLWVKVSPDLTEQEIDDILDVSSRHKKVVGFTTCNTTSHHDSKYIKDSPGKGGASGPAVYRRSLEVQKLFNLKIGNKYKLIACGGIGSTMNLQERIDYGASEAQIYTPLVFKGPRIIRTFREYLNSW